MPKFSPKECTGEELVTRIKKHEEEALFYLSRIMQKYEEEILVYCEEQIQSKRLCFIYEPIKQMLLRSREQWRQTDEQLQYIREQMQQIEELRQRKLEQLQQIRELRQQNRELRQQKRELTLRYQWQLLDSKLTSFIYCLYQFFGEEQKNEVLAALHRLEKSKASKRVIRYKQIVFLLELVWANIQMKFDDIWLTRKNQRVDK